jgi:hypothetical protein
LKKLKIIFTSYEQQLFLSSFYCYFKYDNKTDFVIDLDNIWKWLEFSSKHKSKELLNKLFIAGKDYKTLLTHRVSKKIQYLVPKLQEKKKETRGGHNKGIIMLNIDTFKNFV